MADAMRAMLDGLMGSDRNMTGEEKEKNKRTFDSKDVDKTFLCGCSPWVLLGDTKSSTMLRDGWDLVQDNFLKREWDELPQEEKDKYGFEYDTMKILENLVGQMDRRIAANKARLDEGNELPPEILKQKKELDDGIAELQRRAEELGEQGDVDAASQHISDAAQMTEQRDELVERNISGRRQYVCETTAMVVDDLNRLAEGKLYGSWKTIRGFLNAYLTREGGPPKPKPARPYRERNPDGRRDSERPRERSRERDKDKDKDRDKDRARSRDRRRSRSRSRSKRRDDRRGRSRHDDSRRDDRRDDRRRR